MGAVRTLQAYTNEKLLPARASVPRSSAPIRPRRVNARPRSADRDHHFSVFASVVIILWVGAQDVFAGRTSPGRLGQFVLYAVFAAGGLSQLSDVWGELRKPRGRPSASPNSSPLRPRSHAPDSRCRLPGPPRRGRV